VVMAEVIIDAGARVEGAILGLGARIGAECEVQPGSVIGFGVELEPGRRVVGERVPG
jgi:NDP-sugar pyrophosphorylase family protein